MELLKIAHIDMLPDEILQKIFENLTIVARVRIESVCLRWNRVAKQSWSTTKNFSLYNGTWGFRDPRREQLVDSSVIRKILKRCGPYLVSICMSYVRYKGKAAPFFRDPDSATILEYIAKTCPNLLTINIHRIKTSLESYRFFALNCRNLQSVGLVGPMGDKKSLIQLFKSNPYLVSLSIEDNPYFSLKCMKYLNTITLRWLKIYHCPAFKVNLHCLKTNNILLKFKKLESLLLNLQQRSISLYCIPRELLTYFSVRNTRIDDFHRITDMKYLTHLFLHTTNVDDSTLQRVGEYCRNLHTIYVERSDKLSNLGVSKILDLPYLMDCTFVDVSKVCYDVLDDRYMTNLRRLILNGSIQTVYGYSVERLIAKSPQLEVVSLMRCGIEGMAAIEFIQRVMTIVERRLRPVNMSLFMVSQWDAIITTIRLFNGATMEVIADVELSK